MDATTQPTKGQLWTGRILSTLAILFLTFDSVIGSIPFQSSGELNFSAGGGKPGS